MRVPNLGETDLLVPLHEGMFEQPMWQTFLSRLRQTAGSDFAGLILRTSSWAKAIRLTSSVVDWAEAGDWAMPDWSKLAGTMREDRVYSNQDLHDTEPDGAGTSVPETSGMRAIRLAGDSHFEAIVIVAGRTQPGSDVASLLTALAPHVRTALRVLAKLDQERARSEMSAEAFARINFGWISLDAKCRIVGCDAQAERLLEQSGMLRRGHYDRLTPLSPATDRQLTKIVREFASSPKARPHAIILSHDPWIDILVAPLRVGTLTGGTNAVAVLYIRGDRSSSADRHEQLVDLFDLTPSEARMAWSMAQGMSIAEAATEHGLTIETARNYSKKIYTKTGARGQVDLVRHVLTGVLALA